MPTFKTGDRVRFNERGRVGSKNPLRVGTYLRGSKDGKIDRIHWDGAWQPVGFNVGCLELADESTPETARADGSPHHLTSSAASPTATATAPDAVTDRLVPNGEDSGHFVSPHPPSEERDKVIVEMERYAVSGKLETPHLMRQLVGIWAKRLAPAVSPGTPTKEEQ